MKTPKDQMTGLEYYVKEVLYHDFKQDRGPLEIKWQENIDAFNSVVTNDTWKVQEAEGWRSDTFIPLTKMKVLAGFAMVIDMFLQGGKLPFALFPSPWDNIVLEDLPDEQREIIEDSISDMSGLIHQQLADCQGDRQFIKNVLSGSIYGETYAKFFVHEVIRKGYKQISFAPNGLVDPTGQYTRFEKYQTSVDSPAFGYASVWDVFRDLEVDDVQKGRGIIHRQMTSPFGLKELKGGSFYINENIEEAIKECKDEGNYGKGSDDSSLPPILRSIKHGKKSIERIELWGRVPRKLAINFLKDLKDKGAKVNPLEEYDNDGDEIEVLCEMAGTKCIRFARNDTGKRPWYRAVWEIKLDHAEGTGIADNVKAPQKVVNGMVRGLEDNVKLIANVILAIKKRYLAPGALQEGIKPGEQLQLAEEVDDARKAVQQIIIQDITGSLFNGIPLFERYADESSQLPKILQGVVADKRKPDTLGELNMLQNNAGKYLGSVIKNYDEGLVEPITQDFYEYNMDDPNVKKGKGNFIAQALGFSSFQAKVERLQKLMQALNLAFSNEYMAGEIKVREGLSEIYKALDVDPDQILKSREEKQQEQEEGMQARAQEEAMVRKAMIEEAQLETDKEAAKHEMDMETKELEHEFDVEDADIEFEHDLALESVKSRKAAA